LHNSELWEDLITDLHFRVGVNAHIEASFSVHKTHHPIGRKLHLFLLKANRMPGV
jgi:hypothetical protein